MILAEDVQFICIIWFFFYVLCFKFKSWLIQISAPSFCFELWFRSFCSCLIEPVARSPELRELVEVNLEFQVQFISSTSLNPWNLLSFLSLMNQTLECTMFITHSQWSASNYHVCLQKWKRRIIWLSCYVQSVEKTGGAAGQRPFLQGRLRCCSPAVPQTRRPSPPPGNLPRTWSTQQRRVCFSGDESFGSRVWQAVASAFVNRRLKMREREREVSSRPATRNPAKPHRCVCVCFFLPEQNGKIDMTFFTHDCFHFTIKGHEELAKGLWNNMVNTDFHCLCLTEWQEVKMSTISP